MIRGPVRNGLPSAVSVEHWVTLALEHGCTVISHEAIYRFIYHREADLVLFRQSSDIRPIVHERTSRLTKIIRQPNRSAPTTQDNLARQFDPIARQPATDPLQA